MSIEAKIAAACHRLNLPACLALRERYARLPAPHTFPEIIIPETTPKIAAALARANHQALDTASIRTLWEWTAARPFEQTALARDLLATRFCHDLERRALGEMAARFAISAPPALAAPLDDDVLWQMLADDAAQLSDDELEARVAELDVAALAQLFVRGRGAAIVTEEAARRWYGWIEVLTQAHFPTWASLVAGVLARERGDVHALALWCDIAGDDSLRYPGMLDTSVPSSTFGKARDAVPPIQLRLLQHALRLRRAANGGTVAEIRDLLAVPPLPGAEVDVEMRVLAARVEASVRIRQSEPNASRLFSYAGSHASWRYGRWATLLGWVAAGSLPTPDLLEVVDEFWRSFGGSSSLYAEVGRFASDELFRALVSRAIGDLLVRPEAGDLWVAFALCLGRDKEGFEVREQIWQRLHAQLPREEPPRAA